MIANVVWFFNRFIELNLVSVDNCSFFIFIAYDGIIFNDLISQLYSMLYLSLINNKNYYYKYINKVKYASNSILIDYIIYFF